MKLLLLMALGVLCTAAMAEETNAVKAATNAIATATNSLAKSAPSAANPAGLPSDVVAADNKILALREKMKGLNAQVIAINAKIRERSVAHLPPLPTQNMEISQIQIQLAELRRQLTTAETYDYQLRESHHLPPLSQAGGRRAR